MPRPTPQERLSAATLRAERFAAEFLIDLNASAAYRRAVNPDATWQTAGTEGGRLLKNPQVVKLLEAARLRLMDRLEVSAERVVEEYRRIAFLDPRSVMRWGPDGMVPHDSDSLSEEAAAVVSEVKSKRTVRRDAEGNETEVVEIALKLCSKQAALDSLSKHLGLFKDAGINLNLAGGVLMVPTPVDPESWAKAAREQQARTKPEQEG
jgi:phage terminase small subunit